MNHTTSFANLPPLFTLLQDSEHLERGTRITRSTRISGHFRTLVLSGPSIGQKASFYAVPYPSISTLSMGVVASPRDEPVKTRSMSALLETTTTSRMSDDATLLVEFAGSVDK